MRILLLAGLALASSLVAIPLSASEAAAQQADPPRGLTVTGLGEVRARPDLAVVRVGVVTQAATARAALNDNNSAMEAVLAALEDQDIAERDLQTSHFNVQPRYRYDRNHEGAPRIDGYEVSNQLAVTIRELDKLGPVLDLVVSVGANQILGVEFALADPGPRRDEARRLAVRDAVRKARLYAEAADLVLGPIRAISEQARLSPPQPVHTRMQMAMEDAAVPIAEGEQSIEVEVTINWDIR
jgi:uncharacterized protein